MERVGVQIMKAKEQNNRFMETISCFLKGKKVQWSDNITEKDWMNFFDLSIQHQILPIFFDTVYECPAFRSFPSDRVQALKHLMLCQIMLQSRKTEEFLLLYEKLLDAGLTPIVVKGIICRHMYREPDFRPSGDEDILISTKEFERCRDIFLENDMEYLNSDTSHDTEEIAFRKKGGALKIELHKELFPLDSQAYGHFNRIFNNVFNNTITIDIKGVRLYSMSHTEHLLYLLLHAFKHFLHSGFGVRQICDITLYGNTYGKDVDWDYIYRVMSSVHGELFAASIFEIGRRYLCFDYGTASYPDRWRQLNADGDKLLEDVIDGGIFGDSSMGRIHSSNITLQAVAKQNNYRKSKISLLWHSVFPDKKYMEHTYSYLKNYPFLLPIAWGSRLKKYHKELRKESYNDLKKSIEIGDKRIKLMKKYKII